MWSRTGTYCLFSLILKNFHDHELQDTGSFSSLLLTQLCRKLDKKSDSQICSSFPLPTAALTVNTPWAPSVEGSPPQSPNHHLFSGTMDASSLLSRRLYLSGGNLVSRRPFLQRVPFGDIGDKRFIGLTHIDFWYPEDARTIGRGWSGAMMIPVFSHERWKGEREGKWEKMKGGGRKMEMDFGLEKGD